ncbi:ATP-binding cassette domain-containing protein, partial [Escherichia coli]|uniref:ATP-binding cassette domain-containing protein n=1 Tax=Escherichia coli TaxID=562 RepID=UPI00278C0CDA
GAAGPTAPPSEPLISVRNLVVTYPGRRRWLGRLPGHRAVDGIDLDIRQGETVAVVGGSGSGKTTLGRAILKLVPATSGSIAFHGTDILSAGRTEM